MIKFPIAILVAVVTLLGGFYGGFKMGQGQPATALAASGTTASGAGRNFTGLGACPSPGASPAASGQAGARGATGTITNIATTSFTVHNTRCNTDEKVTFDSSLIVHKTANGTAADLQENQTVTIQGTRQSDGSIKANVITIVPAGAGGFGGAGRGAAAGGNASGG